MKISEFRNHLQSHPESELCFVLPDGGRIAAHAHVTEAGRVDKAFIDCGGTVRESSSCTLQAWVADDVDHRLSPGKLAGVLENAEPLFRGDDLDVEIEYEDGLISQFPVTGASASDNVLYFHLTTKHTDCLAKEICTPASAESTGCCGGGGCG
jgi:hypothetical protein